MDKPNHVCDVVQTRNPLNVLVGDTCRAENGRSIDCDSSNSDPLLHDLQPNHELDTTAGVERARTNPKQHSKVRLGLGCFAFELSNVADVLKFGLSLAQVLSGFTTKTSKNITSFVLAAHFRQPTWRLGEEPNYSEEKEEWEDLERDREAPGKGAIAACVKLATTKGWI